MIFLLVLSLFSTVLNNALQNDVGKRLASNGQGLRCYQICSFSVSFLIFFCIACFHSFSVFSMLLGFLFGAMTFLGTYFRILALSSGPMHITILITTASMLIPTLSGCLFFHEAFSIFRLIAVVILIGFLYLATSGGKKEEYPVTVRKKWLLSCSLAFFGIGMVGVLQKIHQSSEHRNELYGFLASAFLISTGLTLLLKRGKNGSGKPLPKRMYLSAGISGLCVFSMYAINTKLSGELPSQLFFPLVNGSAVVLSTLVSVFVFKERMNCRQIIGLVGGLASLIAICLLP